MKIIIEPYYAKNYKCCNVDRDCKGEECMAWEFETRHIGYKDDNIHSIRPKEPIFEKTGKGYCGFVK